MRVPLSWLRDFAPIEGDPADLAAALSGLGLVVDSVQRVGEGLDGVIVARVLATRAHPQADRVQLVDVDAGEANASQVVCGAFNFGAGDLVAYSPPGTRLPGGTEIGRRKVRGEWSDGMLCSGAELALSDDHSGILVLDPAAEPGAPLTEALGIGADVVFDLDLTPNRPDALSMAGVARDLAAKLRVPFRLPQVPSLDGPPSAGSIEVGALDLCPRFTATVLEAATVRPSPPWVATRLTLAGMRPINNVVDASNYVMLDLGHPNHPYDLDRLPGGGLLVRRARHGEVLVTLDGVERTLAADDCLICDAEGGPVGVAGVMGGASTEIGDNTTRVLLETAYFSPLAVARTSKRLGLRTEASVRFERGVDPHGIDRAVARFAQIAAATAGATVATAPVDVRGELPERPRILVRTSRVNSILGTKLAAADVAGYVEPIGFECRARNGTGDFDVVIPSWRPDCEREIDVIEEVARHHGYANIPRTVPPHFGAGGLSGYQRDRRRVRQTLVGGGLSEAWATSFLAPDDLARAGLPTAAVELENPLVREESVLRTSLLPGLLRALATNEAHRNPGVALFEVGHVFLPPATGSALPIEPENLAAIQPGRPATEATRLWETVTDALGIEVVRVAPAAPPGLHPSRSARLVAGGLSLGVIGEVDPAVLEAYGLQGPVAWFEVDLGSLLTAVPRRPLRYRPVSRFPSADVDLAFVVDDSVPAADMEHVLRTSGGERLEDVWLFDVFRDERLGASRRSLAYRLRFAAPDHTLGEDELARLRTSCIEAVEAAFPAHLRA